jgi:hypothetical protein
MSGFQIEQNGLDVFACAQPVDAEVHAIAGELPLGEVADFDRVGHPAAGVYPEVREDRVRRVGVGDGQLLGARTHRGATRWRCTD